MFESTTRRPRIGKMVLDSKIGLLPTPDTKSGTEVYLTTYDAVNNPELISIKDMLNDERHHQDTIGDSGNNLELVEKPWFDTNKHDLENNAKKILVIVPAWRDPDSYNTVLDLYITSNNPTRVHVLVVMQTIGDVQDRYWHNVSQLNLNAAMANRGFDISNVSWIMAPSDKIRGAGTARRLGWQFVQSYPCDYVLSIDSHSRFALAWDTYLVSVCEELNAHGFDSPCLTGLPLGFEIEPELDTWAMDVSNNISQTPHWDESLQFVSKRLSVVHRAWQSDIQVSSPVYDYNAIKRNDPHHLWKNLSSISNHPTYPINYTEQNHHPILGKGSVELMILGFTITGPTHYQGQFLADYSKRLHQFDEDPEHPYKNVIDIASQGYKIAGGFVFLSSALCRKIEFSTFFKADDEVLPSMRLIRAGAQMFTPNWNVVYHWYGRPGLPRPGWTSAVYNMSSDAMICELGLLDYNYDWRSHALTSPELLEAGFVENHDDIVLSQQDGVRCASASKEYFYNKVGLDKDMLIELHLMECGSKRQVPSLDYLIEKEVPDTVTGKTTTVYYARPFYMFIENMATQVDTGTLIDGTSSIVLKLLDHTGESVSTKIINISKSPATNNNIEVLSEQSAKLLTTMFCYPNKPVPVDFRIISVNNQTHEETTVLASELYTPNFRQYVIDYNTRKFNTV